ncbi:MAG: type IV secretion system DNA-binding domain-containing protein [Patescibacteria group bacterium]|nr:type IV secretion system DNA-binding domain-containing protein [Patescibacteria group bacterium]MDD4695780.1 type IV secretion system DNA-binding domain-containing protein [Patescibacteria group bacterium]
MENEITLIAKTEYRGEFRKFGIREDDRRRHVYIIGKTGMGKSCLIENMVIQDIRDGHGVALVDPHGDLVEKILHFIPANRINDVVYVNPSDFDFPIAFNVLENVDAKSRHLIASGLLGVFKKIWADSWGPRLEYVLNNAIIALLEYPGSTLLGIMRLLVDKDYREKVVKNITDPVVKSFWVDEYNKYPQKFQAEAIAPIQNKVGRFLSTPLTRNIVGQVKSSIDIRQIVDGQKILLLNLSKGRIGEDNSALLGAMIITKIQLAIMSRVDTPEEQRKDFYLYVDEFQNFATESFANILSEARKYRLNLIVAHQYIEQLEETVSAAIFGNVGTMIVFRIGASDAEFLEKEFEPYIMHEDLVNLPKYKIYTKLMIDGVTSDPFQALTLPPIEMDKDGDEIMEKVIKVSRERYTTKREIVEQKILKWSGFLSEEDAIKEEVGELEEIVKEIKNDVKKEITKEIKSSNISNDTKLFNTKCDECDKEINVPFEPDGIRPVYCNDCFAKKKKEKEDCKDLKKTKSMSLEDAFKSQEKKYTENDTNEEEDDDYDPIHKER